MAGIARPTILDSSGLMAGREQQIGTSYRVKKREKFCEVLIVVVAFVIINLLSFHFQQPLSVNEGKGWDESNTIRWRNSSAQGAQPSAPGPFVYRLGTPFLVARLFPSSLLHGFFVVNFAANIIFVVLLVAWLRLYLANWKVRVLLVLLYMASWHHPPRLTYFCAALTDNWGNVFTLTGLIAIEKMGSRASWSWLMGISLLSFVGVLFRENVFLVPVAALFAGNPTAWDPKAFVPIRLRCRPPLRTFLPLTLTLIALVCVRSITIKTNHYSYLSEIINWILTKNPSAYIHDLFICYGVIPYLLLFFWRIVLASLAARQFQFVFLSGVALLAYIGGLDMVRFFGWAAPVVLLLVGRIVEGGGRCSNRPGYWGYSVCVRPSRSAGLLRRRTTSSLRSHRSRFLHLSVPVHPT